MADGYHISLGNPHVVLEFASSFLIGADPPSDPRQTKTDLNMKPESFPMLRFRGVQVRFDGVTALDLAELDVFDQSRLAIFLGPNGGGKSSLINAVTGYVPVRAPGKIIFEN